ncbi:TetR/AcrR family transcriptional regulator [Eubacteriaceae bacterium ES3]|nr:TetR/AcrR family transcriptional regulator [Eubacteriaceae bacterium ES3]
METGQELENLTTKEKIFEIGIRLFKEHGYKQVSIIDICQACGITKTTFYHHLNSKQEILLSYYDHVIGNLTPLLLELLNTTNSWDQIVLLFDNLITSMEELGPDLNGQILSFNLAKNLGTFEIRKELEDVAVKIIKTGQENGELRNTADPLKLFEAAAYMFTGYEFTWCINNGDFPWKQKFNEALRLMLAPKG